MDVFTFIDTYASLILPNSWVLRCVILIMIILAFTVAKSIVTIGKITRENSIMIDQMLNVDVLENAALSDNIDSEAEFLKYEKNLGKTSKTVPLFEHLKAIYDAGVKSSRLDADLLVENTVNRIFSGTDFLRTRISIFLVIGILGTLFGLASSISEFHYIQDMMSGTNSDELTNALTNFFPTLKGAFEPSIYGISFTILFVILYSVLVQEKINKFKEKLTITTIRIWLPKLYPTDFQRGDKSIHKLNAVITNANGINRGVTDLEKNLDSSNKTLRALTQVSDQINAATTRFDKSTTKIARLESLYNELKQSNANFNNGIHKFIESAISERNKTFNKYNELVEKNYSVLKDNNQDLTNRINEIQKGLNQRTEKEIGLFYQNMKIMSDKMESYFDQLYVVLDKQKDSFATNLDAQQKSWQSLLSYQEKQLADVIQQLRSYDTNFFQMINDSSTQLQRSVDNNQKAVDLNQQLGEKLRLIEDNLLNRQDDVIKAIQAPIVEQLRAISDNLKQINDPLGASVKSIQGMMDYNIDKMNDIVNQMNDIVKPAIKLINDLDKRKEEVEIQTKETNRLFSEMNKRLIELNDNVSKLKVTIKRNLSNSPTTIYSEQDNEVIGELGTEHGGILLSSLKKNVAWIFISIVLIVSAGIQVAMLNKISNLEENQAIVTGQKMGVSSSSTQE